MSAVFLFTLLSGLAVLYAALLATQDERIHQAAILRTLGADSRYLRRLHLTGFAVLGALSGLFAATGRLDAGNQSTGISYLHRSSSSIRASPSNEKFFFAMGALVRSVRCGGNFQ